MRRIFAVAVAAAMVAALFVTSSAGAKVELIVVPLPGNVNVMYGPDYSKKPTVRKNTTLVFTGTRWHVARHDARVVTTSTGGITYKQLRLLKGEIVINAQVSYIGANRSVYTSVPWDGRGLKALRTTMMLNGVTFKMRIDSITAEIHSPNRPVEQSGTFASK